MNLTYFHPKRRRNVENNILVNIRCVIKTSEVTTLARTLENNICLAS